MTAMETIETCIPDLLRKVHGTLAVAESLTGGLLSSQFARMDDASQWFRGGIVAYCRPVKEDLLHIGAAPVVSERAARAMATQAARQLGATIALAATGVGGPGAEHGHPAGTVWLAVHTPTVTRAELHHFQGPPEDVCEQTCRAAVQLLVNAICRGEAHPAPCHPQGFDADDPGKGAGMPRPTKVEPDDDEQSDKGGDSDVLPDPARQPDAPAD